MKNRLFIFANYEGRRDAQGSSVLRTVPSASLRAGDLVYLCADPSQCPGGTVNGVTGVQPGYYALGPDQIKKMDPLGIGVSPAVQSILAAKPLPKGNPTPLAIIEKRLGADNTAEEPAGVETAEKHGWVGVKVSDRTPNECGIQTLHLDHRPVTFLDCMCNGRASRCFAMDTVDTIRQS